MKHGINKNGINYFLVNDKEYFCTYNSSDIDIEVTLKDVTIEYIENLTLSDLIKINLDNVSI